MTNLTLTGWKRSVAAGLVETVPLQEFESAFLLAEQYLSSQGGWNPDDAGDPTGPGVPVSNVTTGEAIEAIFNEQMSRIYQIEIAGSLAISAFLNENLSPGLSDADVFSNTMVRVQEFLEAEFTKTNLRFDNIISYTGTVTTGPTTSQERVSIQTSIGAGGKIVNPREIALIAARARFDLDTTYNVEYLYTEANKDLFVLVRKYTNTQYTTADTTTDNKFGIKLDSDSFRVTTGVVLPNS